MQNSVYLGKQIGNYQITNVLASGSFGTVFLAHHVYLKQRLVVIKFLHAIRLDSQEEKEQFLQEAQFLEMLRGLPHILPLLDVGVERESDIPYLITEYAEHGSLRQRIQASFPDLLPLNEALEIVTQVGKGLQSAHDRKIVHRDIKPENILFNAKGEALLADFGISTTLETASVKYTDIVGTPAYMAPEQFRGEVSKESDQYGLACIAYELLTGLKPFSAADIMALGFLHTSEEPIPLREHNFYIPKHIESAILRAMAKKRSDRFADVTAFIDALLKQSQPRLGKSNTRPLDPGEQDEVQRDILSTIAATPVIAEPARTDKDAESGAPIVASSLPLYLPGPAEVEQVPSAPPPPFAYAPQSLTPPPPPHVQQSYQSMPQGGQVQMQVPRSYGEHQATGAYGSEYIAPKSVSGAERTTLSTRFLAVLYYLLPILSWIAYIRADNKKYFLRFHFLQAFTGWAGFLLCMMLLNSRPYPQGIVFLFFVVALIISIWSCLAGKVYKIPPFGQLASWLTGRTR